MSRQRAQQQEDEALARALQMQYEREMRSSARPPNVGSSNQDDEAIARRIQEHEIHQRASSATSPQRGLRDRRVTAPTSPASAAAMLRAASPTFAHNSNHTTGSSSNSNTAADHRGRPVSPTPLTPTRTRTGAWSPPPARARSPSPVIVNNERSDEELARRLAAEEEAAVLAQSRNTSTVASGGYVFASSGRNTGASNGYVFPAEATAPSTEMSSSGGSDDLLPDEPSNNNNRDFRRVATVGGRQEHTDREFARRVEQEMQDELVAERLQQKEQRRANERQAAQLSAAGAQPRRRKAIGGTIVAISLAVGAVVALIYYFVIVGGGVPSINLTPEDFADEDPFDAMDPNEANSWRNNGNGVRLTVINALETRWYQFFYDAVDDWDSGYPDTLTLDTEFNSDAGATSHEVICSTVTGKVKVCNGNYGNTRWKGINEVLIDGSGNIIASAARMNEFYLGGRDENEMHYTMCHELGHAWGLGHTDETFGNADLGDCMDYTNKPENNLKPTIRNFSFLYELYGLAPGAAPYSPPTAAPSLAPTNAAPVTVVAQNSNIIDHGGRKLVRSESERTKQTSQDDQSQSPRPTQRSAATSSALRQTSPKTTIQDGEEMPEWLTESIDSVLDRHQGRRLRPEVWRVVHHHDSGEAHEVDLASGYRLRVHYLWASESDQHN